MAILAVDLKFGGFRTFLGLILAIYSPILFAADPPSPPALTTPEKPGGSATDTATGATPSPVAPVAADKAARPEEDDFTGTPFTEYGEFNENDDEEADADFFQHGRFFGVSLGLGYEAADGNRGTLWQGGFPVVDFKIHYWFDFNFAIDLNVYNATHFFTTNFQNEGLVNVNLLRLGVDIKYYFNTKDLSSAASFANPYVLIGAGAYNKIENASSVGAAPSSLTSLGVCGGAGLEFAVSPKKVYLALEAKIHLVQFQDNNTTVYAAWGTPNLNGNLWTFTGNALFTW